MHRFNITCNSASNIAKGQTTITRLSQHSRNLIKLQFHFYTFSRYKQIEKKRSLFRKLEEGLFFQLISLANEVEDEWKRYHKEDEANKDTKQPAPPQVFPGFLFFVYPILKPKRICRINKEIPGHIVKCTGWSEFSLFRFEPRCVL